MGDIKLGRDIFCPFSVNKTTIVELQPGVEQVVSYLRRSGGIMSLVELE